MTEAPDDKRDFLVSFNRADRAWATWIAWALEEAGYSVFFQDWDFRGNFVEHMTRAHQQAQRTLAVLSDHYLGSDFTLAEWSARFAQDPAAREDRLVPVKVGPLADEGVLGPLVYADLTGCDEAEARERLLGRVAKAVDASHRPKPAAPPGFPGGAERQVPAKPGFPTAPTTGTAAVRTEPIVSRRTVSALLAAGAVVLLLVLAALAFRSPRITATNSAATGGDISHSNVTINSSAPAPRP